MKSKESLLFKLRKLLTMIYLLLTSEEDRKIFSEVKNKKGVESFVLTNGQRVIFDSKKTKIEFPEKIQDSKYKKPKLKLKSVLWFLFLFLIVSVVFILLIPAIIVVKLSGFILKIKMNLTKQNSELRKSKFHKNED